MARPTMAQQARNLRRRAGLTQAEAADEFGCSQAQISGIERDERSALETRRYLRFLKGRSVEPEPANDERGDGSSWWGDRLDEHFDYNDALPGTWVVRGLARTSKRSEIAIVTDADDRTAFVGFHLIDGEIKVGKRILIEEENRDDVFELVKEWRDGTLGDFDEDDDDDELLTDDDEED